MDNIGEKVINGLLWKFLERMSAQLVSFVVSIVLARLLDPSDYGTIAVVMVFISIANVFVSSGLGTALVQKKNADNIDFTSVFYFNFVFSIILYLVLFVSSPLIASFYSMPILSPVLRILSLQLILAAINTIQQAYVSKTMKFYHFFWATSIGTIGSAFVGIIMALKGFGVWALVVQTLFNSAINTFVLWITVQWRPSAVFNLKRLRELLNFGWKILVNNLVITIYDNLKSLIIGKQYTSIDLAYYSKGIQLPNLIVTNINSSIGSVLLPALSILQDDYVAVKNGVKRAIRVSAFVMLPMMAGLFATAPHIINLILTDKWLPCIPFLRIACIYYAFYPITTANQQAVDAVGRSDISLKLTLYKRIFGVILIMLSIPYGIVAMAITDILVTLLAIVLNSIYNKKFFDYSFVEQLSELLPSMLISATMAFIIIISDELLILVIGNEILILLIQSLIGFTIYTILSICFNRSDFIYFINKIKEIIK